MSEGMIVRRGGGGMQIKGKLKTYSIITADDVTPGEFVRDVTEQSTSTFSLNSNTNTGEISSTVSPSKGIIFVAHISDQTNYRLACSMAQVVDNKVVSLTTAVTNRTLQSSNWTALNIDAMMLEDNKILILHTDGSSYRLAGTIVKVNGSSTTVGAATTLNSTANSGLKAKGIVISPTKVLVAFYSATTSLAAMIITIDGDTMSPGMPVVVGSPSTSTQHFSLIKTTENSAFLAYGSGATYTLTGVMIKILETAVEKKTASTFISSDYSGRGIGLALVSGGVVAVFHNDTSSNYLNCQLIKIAISDIIMSFSILGTDTRISSASGYGESIKAITLRKNLVFCIHAKSSVSSIMYGILIDVIADSVSVVKEDHDYGSTKSYTSMSLAQLSTDSVVVGHWPSSVAYCTAIFMKYGLYLATQTNLMGVCTRISDDGRLGDVYIPSLV